jgi:hypothetical protein
VGDLYERCPICEGSGLREFPLISEGDARRGFLCPACRGEKFAPVGLSFAQARRAVEDRDRLMLEVKRLEALNLQQARDWAEAEESLVEAWAEIDRLEAAQPDPRGEGSYG